MLVAMLAYRPVMHKAACQVLAGSLIQIMNSMAVCTAGTLAIIINPAKWFSVLRARSQHLSDLPAFGTM